MKLQPNLPVFFATADCACPLMTSRGRLYSALPAHAGIDCLACGVERGDGQSSQWFILEGFKGVEIAIATVSAGWQPLWLKPIEPTFSKGTGEIK